MLTVPMMELESDKITIKGQKFAIIDNMMEFIYTGGVRKLDEENAEDLFKAADQYLLPGLKRICEIALIAGLTVDNSLGMLYLGHAYHAPDLKKTAKQRIVDSGGWNSDALNLPRAFVFLGPEFLEQTDWKTTLQKCPDLMIELFESALRK